jgi:plasmid stability protein
MEAAVATITIRNLDDSIKARLRVRAASHARSMEEEARAILREALQGGAAGRGLGTLIHRRFMAAGGAELHLPERKQRPRKAVPLP